MYLAETDRTSIRAARPRVEGNHLAPGCSVKQTRRREWLLRARGTATVAPLPDNGQQGPSSLEQQLDLGMLLCGKPETVLGQLRHIRDEIGAGVISLNFETGLARTRTEATIHQFARDVLPGNARAMSGRLEPRRIDLPGGARIEYVEVGHGQPVVYFHGAGGVFRNAAFLPALAQRYRVLAPARPGVRRLDRTWRVARDESAVIAEFVRQTVGGPVHVLAESAGGAAACWLAVLDPDLVAAWHAGRADRLRRGSHVPPSTPEAMELRLFGRDRPGVSRRRTLIAPLVSATHRPTPAGCGQRRQRRAARSDCSEIDAPTLVLWGTADEARTSRCRPGIRAADPEQLSDPDLWWRRTGPFPVAACRQFVARVTSDFIERGDRFVVGGPE